MDSGFIGYPIEIDSPSIAHSYRTPKRQDVHVGEAERFTERDERLRHVSFRHLRTVESILGEKPKLNEMSGAEC